MGPFVEKAATTATIRGKIPPRLVAMLAVLLARWSAHCTLAVSHPFAAVFGLLWVTADALMLALLASTARHKPAFSQIIATLAVAAGLTWLNAPGPLRTALASSPVISAGLIGIVLAHLLISSGQALRVWQHCSGLSFGERMEAAAGQLLPPHIVRLAGLELRILWLALFSWRAAPDIPEECQGFSYHRHLAPQMWALLAIAVIEAGGEHILIRHWSVVAGTVLAVIGDLGLIYMIGLVKSLRLRPVLLTPEGLRIRAGYLIDRLVPYEQIAGLRHAFTGEDLRANTNWNMGLLAWPNVMLDLKDPLHRRNLHADKRLVTSLAFRLDEPEPFLRLLEQRLCAA